MDITPPCWCPKPAAYCVHPVRPGEKVRGCHSFIKLADSATNPAQTRIASGDLGSATFVFLHCNSQFSVPQMQTPPVLILGTLGKTPFHYILELWLLRSQFLESPVFMLTTLGKVGFASCGSKCGCGWLDTPHLWLPWGTWG